MTISPAKKHLDGINLLIFQLRFERRTTNPLQDKQEKSGDDEIMPIYLYIPVKSFLRDRDKKYISQYFLLQITIRPLKIIQRT